MRGFRGLVLSTLSVEYFDQLLGAARQVHVVYLAQLLGAVLFIHIISIHYTTVLKFVVNRPCSEKKKPKKGFDLR